VYKIYDLYNGYNINKNSNHSLSDIKSFFEINKKVLFLEWDELEEEFAINWTHDKFVILLESIFVLNQNDIIFNKIVFSDNEREQELIQIQENIFDKNSFEELYNKFILPKAILEKDIDYWFSEISTKYVANLTYSVDDINKIITVLTDIFKFDNSTSLERRRSMRKKWLELIIAWLFRNENIKKDKDFIKMMYKMFDDWLQKEIKDDTDKELGSLHNVLYWFISHLNIYKRPCFKYTKNSHYQFIQFIPELLKILNNNLLTK